MNTENLYINQPYSLPIGIRLTEMVRMLFSRIAGNDSEVKSREEKFASVMKEFGPTISGICFSYSRNADDLKDLRQDIMINIWKGLSTYRGDSSLSTWVYRVALNTCVSTIRKRSKQPFTTTLDGINDSPDESDNNKNEQIETLHQLISSLSPLDKAIITMWLDERRYEEIAEVTGISRNNVAVRINRIKQKLADNFPDND